MEDTAAARRRVGVTAAAVTVGIIVLNSVVEVVADSARERRLAEVVGEPKHFHADWSYATARAPLRGARCASCKRRIRPRAASAVGTVAAPRSTGLPADFRGSVLRRRLRYRYCSECGARLLAVGRGESTADALGIAEPAGTRREGAVPSRFGFIWIAAAAVPGVAALGYGRSSGLVAFGFAWLLGLAAVVVIAKRRNPLIAAWLALVLVCVTVETTRWRSEHREDAPARQEVMVATVGSGAAKRTPWEQSVAPVRTVAGQLRLN